MKSTIFGYRKFFFPLFLFSVFVLSCNDSSDEELVLSIEELDFLVNPKEGTAPLTVLFRNTSTLNPEGWLWNFGDGNISTLENPTHTYQDGGQYSIELSAYIGEDTISVTKEHFISVSEPLIPIVGFSIEESGIAPSTPFHFIDETIGTVTERLWDFGDGNTSTSENPVHTYLQAGIYTVCLTVTGPGGSTIGCIENIRVNQILELHNLETPKFWPPHLTGDKELGNNPSTYVRGQIVTPRPWEVVEDVEIQLYMFVGENDGTGTSAQGSQTFKLFDVSSLGPNLRYLAWQGDISNPELEFSYNDSDHGYDYFPQEYNPNIHFGRFQVMGSTNGNDVGNTTLDDSHFFITDIDIRVLIGPIY